MFHNWHSLEKLNRPGVTQPVLGHTPPERRQVGHAASIHQAVAVEQADFATNTVGDPSCIAERSRVGAHHGEVLYVAPREVPVGLQNQRDYPRSHRRARREEGATVIASLGTAET